MRLIKPSDMKAVHKKIVLHDRSIPLLILYRKNKELTRWEIQKKNRKNELAYYGFMVADIFLE